MPITENFSVGASDTALLPANWKFSGAGLGTTAGWADSGNFTRTTRAASSGSPITGGRYNWSSTFSTGDRAIGFMTDANYLSPNSIMAYYRNNTGGNITAIDVSFTIERYRTNTNIFSLSFLYSTDGVNWIPETHGDIATNVFATGTSAYHFISSTTITRNITINVNIANTGDFYLKWVFFNANSINSQGLGLDNVSVTARPLPLSNPNLSASCPYNLILVLDESGSIVGAGGGTVTNISAGLRSAVKTFISALNATGNRVAVLEFGTGSRRASIGGSTSYQVVDDTYISNFNTYIGPDGNTTSNNLNYDPEDGTSQTTNWESALDLVQTINSTDSLADLIVFFTDGRPTDCTGCSGNSDTIKPLNQATVSANEVKAQGSHLFVVGFTNPTIPEVNLQQISGSYRYPDLEADINLADYSVVNAASDLSRIFTDLGCKIHCNPFAINAANTLIPTLHDQDNALGGQVSVHKTHAGATWNLEVSVYNSAGTFLYAIVYPSTTDSTIAFSTTSVSSPDVQLKNAIVLGYQLKFYAVEANGCTVYAGQTDIVECVVSSSCNDNSACTQDTCDSGFCLNTSINCDDGNVCNGAETCDLITGCENGTPLNCDDGNTCTFDTCMNGCISRGLEVSATPTHVVCHGNSNGSVIVDVTGGVVPYSYLWSTNQTTKDLFGIPAGNYNLTVTDSRECKAMLSVQIMQPPLCNDLNACTVDSCNNGLCIFTPIVCADQDLCTSDNCVNGNCVFTVLICNGNQCTVPAPGTNLLPADHAIDLSLPVQFSWPSSAHATYYDLYLWPESGTRPVAPTFPHLTQINFPYGGSLVTYGNTYKWQVIASNACLQTAGPVYTFTLRELPDLTVNQVLAPASAFSEQTISISWEIKNAGNGSTINQHWYDKIFLSADATLDLGDISLAGVLNLSYLAANQSYLQTTNITLPQGISGNYFVFIKTDYSSSVTETDNNNNTGRNLNPVQVTLTPPPDLKVTSIVTPLNVFSGQNVSISWTVKNDQSGETNASNWHDRVYISSDTALNIASAITLGTFSHTGLLPSDSTYSNTKQITIPNTIFGTYYVYVTCDITDKVYEHAFEANNTSRSAAITIFLTPPPDLVVTQISCPDSVSIKESVGIEWTVKNQGGSDPLPGIIWVDRVFLTTDPNYILTGAREVAHYFSSPLQPGESYTRQVNISIPDNISGPYYLYVKTDAGDLVFEYTFESNNTLRSNSVQILKPDLTVSTVTAPPTDSSGTKMPVQWTVKNNGPGKVINESWTDRIFISANAFYDSTAIQVGTQSYSAQLNANSTVSRSSTITVPNGISGNYYVHVYSDYDNSVREVSNANNVGTSNPVIITLSPWPDLSVTNLQVQNSITAGNTVPFQFSVKNSGIVTAGNPWTDRIYISADSAWNSAHASQLAEITRSQELRADSSYSSAATITIPPQLTGGTYYFFVYTDSDDSIYEHTGETNNIRRSSSITILPYPPVDLAIIAASGPSSALTSGQSISIQYTVKNIGAFSTLLNSWKDATYLSLNTTFETGIDIFISEWSHAGGLSPNATYTTHRNVTIPNGVSGAFYLLVVTDKGHANNDINFLNNSRSITDTASQVIVLPVTLNPPPDLIITSFSTPAEAIAGQPFKLFWTVRNEGTGPATAGWLERFYLSSDNVINPNDKMLGSSNHSATLNPGGSYSDSLTVTPSVSSAGNYIVIMKTDANNSIYEHIYEGNNLAFQSLTVLQADPSDLIVSEIIPPSVGIAGKSVTVTWSLKNTGSNPATGSTKEGVYFSKDTILDAGDALFGIHDGNIGLVPQAQTTHSLSGELPGLALGDYYVIVSADLQNNIPESFDDNNISASNSLMTVTVPLLALNVLTPDTLHDNKDLFYRIEVPAAKAGETMVITLKGDSVNGDNELYLSHGQMPTRSSHGFSHLFPFSGNQELIVPSLKQGTYYLLVYGKTSPGNVQNISLHAELLDFEIRRITENSGGNTGPVTIKIEGSRFTEDMEVILRNDSLNIALSGYNLVYIDPTEVFITFSLSSGQYTGNYTRAGVEVGFYDVVIRKPTREQALLKNGFEVVDGTGPVLLLNLQYPSSTRPLGVISMQVQFANGGNVDVPLPTRALVSHFSSPVGLSVSDLGFRYRDLYLEFKEFNGPPDVLRPGATSTYVVYSQATNRLKFSLIEIE